jgi:hypothetical protein
MIEYTLVLCSHQLEQVLTEGDEPGWAETEAAVWVWEALPIATMKSCILVNNVWMCYNACVITHVS